MAYADVANVKKVLKDTLYSYPASIEDELEFAEAYVNGRLAGHYPLTFDDTSLYTSVPRQIKWITSYLVAYKLWDFVVPLEGQTDDTAAARWKKLADDWLDRLVAGDETLILDDGTLVVISNSGAPRFYPSGIKEKADSADNEPWFTRSQVGEW